MNKENEKLLEIGRNIFKQLEASKFSRNVIISPKDAELLFNYIFSLEKAYDKLKEEQEPKEEENVKD